MGCILTIKFNSFIYVIKESYMFDLNQNKKVTAQDIIKKEPNPIMSLVGYSIWVFAIINRLF
jgi:hypothetical protein